MATTGTDNMVNIMKMMEELENAGNKAYNEGESAINITGISSDDKESLKKNAEKEEAIPPSKNVKKAIKDAFDDAEKTKKDIDQTYADLNNILNTSASGLHNVDENDNIIQKIINNFTEMTTITEDIRKVKNEIIYDSDTGKGIIKEIAANANATVDIANNMVKIANTIFNYKDATITIDERELAKKLNDTAYEFKKTADSVKNTVIIFANNIDKYINYDYDNILYIKDKNYVSTITTKTCLDFVKTYVNNVMLLITSAYHKTNTLVNSYKKFYDNIKAANFNNITTQVTKDIIDADKQYEFIGDANDAANQTVEIKTVTNVLNEVYTKTFLESMNETIHDLKNSYEPSKIQFISFGAREISDVFNKLKDNNAINALIKIIDDLCKKKTNPVYTAAQTKINENKIKIESFFEEAENYKTKIDKLYEFINNLKKTNDNNVKFADELQKIENENTELVQELIKQVNNVSTLAKNDADNVVKTKGLVNTAAQLADYKYVPDIYTIDLKKEIPYLYEIKKLEPIVRDIVQSLKTSASPSNLDCDDGNEDYKKMCKQVQNYQKTSEENYEQMNEYIKQTEANENNSDESLKNANLAKESGINGIIEAEHGKCSLEIAKIREKGEKPTKPADPTQTQLTKEKLYAEILNAKRAAKVAMETAKRLGTKTSMASAIQAQKLVNQALRLYNAGGDAWNGIGQFIAAAMEYVRRATGTASTAGPAPSGTSSTGTASTGTASTGPTPSTTEPTSSTGPAPAENNDDKLIVPEYCNGILDLDIMLKEIDSGINNNNYRVFLGLYRHIYKCINNKYPNSYKNDDTYKHNLRIFEKYEKIYGDNMGNENSNVKQITPDYINNYLKCINNKNYNIISSIEKGDKCFSQNITNDMIPYCFGEDQNERNKNIKKWNLFLHPDKNQNCSENSQQKYSKFSENVEMEKLYLKRGGKKTLKRKRNYLKKRKFNSLKKHKRYKR